jgi:hypothetical protein
VSVAFTRAFVPLVDVAGGRIVIAREAIEDAALPEGDAAADGEAQS